MTTIASPAIRPAMDAHTNGRHRHNNQNGVSGTTSSKVFSHSSEHLRRLTDPPPTSMVLVACLQLLTAPLVPPHNVYLMTQQYLQNWLNWAYQQPLSSPNEKERLKEVIRLAAVRHSLACPTPDTLYSDPGPINANDLSMQGHPLLLRPDASVLVQPAPKQPVQPLLDESTPAALRRARSLPNSRAYLDAALSGANGESPAEFRSCAVPEQFYEVRLF